MVIKTLLSEKLSVCRTDRPDEWTMDEFKRDAVKLEEERNEALAQRDKLRKRLSSERRLYRELKKAMDSANEKLAAMERQEPVAEVFKNSSTGTGIDWAMTGEIPEGATHLYAKPAPADTPARITEQDARDIAMDAVIHYSQKHGMDYAEWMRSGGRALLNKLNADREKVPAVAVPDEEVAKMFHESYEKLAPSFGYETREETRKDWEGVPPNNKALMIAVIKQIRLALLTSSHSQQSAVYGYVISDGFTEQFVKTLSDDDRKTAKRFNWDVIAICRCPSHESEGE